ncbi:DUF6354 family protein [Streptomyces sp. SP18BB07]|uniref:DUF6354 family protein n=1 Tax=Streptomyces sp. SP18BB07 TaxID=3002522 RepID=UPI002E77664F|nr:DUF6354 family protein [Streptomyces sp. SP18BB07]MEE1759735.1 DUF6354 family protein [Streptomyces sp. SP18BB07]
MTREIPQSTGRMVEEGQLYRDLDRYMADRDRRLRVGPTGPDGRAACVVEHDLHQNGALVGRTTPIHVSNLGNPRKFELLAETDAVAADPRYTRPLTNQENGDCDAHRILCDDGPGMAVPGGIRDVPRDLTGRPGERWCPSCLPAAASRREESQPS